MPDQFTNPRGYLSEQGIPGSGRSLRDTLRSGELGQIIGPALCQANAQQQGGPLGIQNIRRGLLAIDYTHTATYTIGVGAVFVDVDATNLSGLIYCSGRPLEVSAGASAAQAGATGTLLVSIALDGVEVTGNANGLWASNLSASLFGFTTRPKVVTPTPGQHRISLVAYASTAAGSIYGTTGVSLMAKEL